MRIIFAGTPDFAVSALEKITTQHQVVAVLTQPDRASGRGQKINLSPIKLCALKHNLPILQPRNLKSQEIQQKLKSFNADIMVVAAFGMILPLEVLKIPKIACLNIHASLLPRWRGAAPIQRAILHGDKTSGICIMQMDEGLDTGAVYSRVETKINENENAQQLHERLKVIGANEVVQVLANIQQLRATPQSNTNACYAEKISKQEAIINWQHDCTAIVNKIRAFNPYPVAQTSLKGKTVRIWQAHKSTLTTKKMPGTIISFTPDLMAVACKDGVIELTKLQLAGKKPMTIRDFYNGHKDIRENLDTFV